MKCADPLLCYTNSKGARLYRNFSLASQIFKMSAQTVFDCGKCLHCRKKRAYELASRCVLHASLYKENCFLTLTYDEKKNEYHNNFQYSDIQKFKKRLRSYVKRLDGRTLDLFNVHEYGRNGKKHWHLICFNWEPSDKEVYTVTNAIPLYTSKKLSRLWSHGYSTIGAVTEASAMYQAQYMEKDFKNYNVATNKKAHSKHSGLGRPYFLKHYRQILTLGFIPFGGKKMPIPRYFQKLAHKHYSHFYEPQNFFPTKKRQRLYTPFKVGQENKEIADLFIDFRNLKETKTIELQNEWCDVISQHLTTKEEPDFIKSASNNLYDLRNKISEEKF